MTPQRRGILVTLLVLGLTLAAAFGVVLAKSASANPGSGPRDDGNNNQKPIALTGDLLDGSATASWARGWPRAYWDLDDTSTPDSSHEMTYTSAPTIDSGGVFAVSTEVPLYDAAIVPVRPGIHHITVCAVPLGATGIPICATDSFTVKQGTAVLSKTQGRPGDGVTITGTQWVPGNADEEVRIIWDPPGSGTELTDNFYPDSSAWSLLFDVPLVAPGTYKIRICHIPYTGPEAGQCASADTVVRQFKVVPPTVSLNKSSGQSGDPVKVSGSYFFASRSLLLFFGPTGAALSDPSWTLVGPPSMATDTNGEFGPYTINPTGAAGDYTVLACTAPVSLQPSDACDVLDIGQAPYTIAASKTPTPTASPSPTAAPSATPTPSPTQTPSPTITPSPTATPTAPPTATPSATPSDTPSPTPSALPTVAPTPTATPSPTPAVVSWPEHLRSPGQTGGAGFDLTTLGGMSLLALLIAFLVPFPGTLFNKTVEANYTEIQGWIGGARRRWDALLNRLMVGPLGRLRRGAARLSEGRLGVFVFLGLSALVYGFLSPTFGLDTDSLALFLGLLVGLMLITAAFDLPLRIYHGRTSREHDQGVLHALWWTLLVAVICVVVSRLADFQPGYLYGLIASIVFVTEISQRDEGIGNWLASVWLIVLSFAAWVLLALVRQGYFDPWLSLFLQTVLVTFVVAGIESLAIGLLPMRFLPGHPTYQWRRGMWFVVFALSVMGYLLILVDPANGYLSDDSRTPMIVGLIFLVGFGIVSLGTWAYFRYRPARPGGDRPGEAPAE